MIMIIGGIHQGKRQFAARKFPEAQVFLDGNQADWETFLNGRCVYNLHQMIRRRLEAGESAADLEGEMAKQLMRACPNRILITDEIGCGIVPVDPFQREYRELTGRICCQLAAEAKQVWRVTAGIGARIK